MITDKIVREQPAVDSAEYLVSLVVKGIHHASSEKKGSRGTKAQQQAKKIKAHQPIHELPTQRWIVPVEVEGDSFVVTISKLA